MTDSTHVYDGPPDPEQIIADLSQGVEALIRSVLEKSPDAIVYRVPADEPLDIHRLVSAETLYFRGGAPKGFEIEVDAVDPDYSATFDGDDVTRAIVVDYSAALAKALPSLLDGVSTLESLGVSFTFGAPAIVTSIPNRDGGSLSSGFSVSFCKVSPMPKPPFGAYNVTIQLLENAMDIGSDQPDPNRLAILEGLMGGLTQSN
ncbi:MAG: hypothetical protein AAGF99_00310 [Bacteroidota bacterium]